ncbi:universal stress protein [Caldimonas sp. KR1-144]|uniref:universal stress protein n=1 Tax=Caldimonas sp. KR1-144 TaxID=3400911 RepID=UPI003BFFA5AB
MKILIAADGSDYTKRMLAYIAAHDEWLGSGAHEFTVLTVVPAVPARAAAVIDRETLKGYYEEEGEKVFKPVRSFFAQQGREATFVSKVGHAAEVIAHTASAGDFDLIIMGSHGHSAIGKLVMGSVTTRVLADCSVPVLLVR